MTVLEDTEAGCKLRVLHNRGRPPNLVRLCGHTAPSQGLLFPQRRSVLFVTTFHADTTRHLYTGTSRLRKREPVTDIGEAWNLERRNLRLWPANHPRHGRVLVISTDRSFRAQL